MKDNLIFINGFAANKDILKNLILLFKEVFNVYVIDLPGFYNNPIIKKANLKNITDYIDKEIKNLKIKNYIIGGLSLGYLVATKTNAIKKAKAVLGIYPYLNMKNINLSNLQININKEILKIILKEETFYEIAWNSGFVKELMIINKYNEKIIDSLINNCNPKLFFETAYLLLTYNQKPAFYNKPYVLIVNDKDELINTKITIPIFKKNVKKLWIIKSNIPHVPKKLTKSYFRESFTKQKIKKLKEFMKKNA